jgi:hypothetical protein
VGDRKQPVRLAPALAVTAAAGFLLGSCGGDGGGALTTRPELSVTRPTVTATRPEVTVTPPTLSTPTETETSPVTTVEEPVVTTTEATTTTAPSPTVTVTETETTEAVPTAPETTETVPTVTETATTAPTTTAVAAEPTSSSDDTRWEWILVGLALLVGLVVGVVAWRARRNAVTSWSNRMSDLSRRSLVALDDVLAEGSVVTGRIQALAADARALERHAPDERSGAASAQVRARLDELADTLAADRAVRLASPPPSPEQLSYSTALIRQQVEQLQGVLRPPPPDEPGR